MTWKIFVQDLRAEFRLKKFTFSGPNPAQFLTFQWQRQGQNTSLFYMLYKWLWCIYHVSWWIVTFLDTEFPNYYAIKLTNLTYMLLTIFTTYWAILATYYYFQYKKKSTLLEELTVPLKILWVLQEAVFLSSFVVTCAYWAAVYSPDVPIDEINAIVHICNSVYVLIELMVSASPVNILHFFVPLLYLSSYLIFTIIYWAVGGTDETGSHAIYPITDWDNLPLTLPFVILCGLFSPVMQAVIWLFYELRLLAWGRCQPQSYAVKTPEEHETRSPAREEGDTNNSSIKEVQVAIV